MLKFILEVPRADEALIRALIDRGILVAGEDGSLTTAKK